MYRVILFLLVSFTACSSLEITSGLSIYEAVNKAGYQRMLTQRIAKCYISIVAKVDPEHYKADLKVFARKFEANLIELKNYAPTEKIRDYYSYVEILWRDSQFVYKDDFTIENAVIILENSNKILKASHAAVLSLEEYAIEKNLYEDEGLLPVDPDLAAVINLSGRQRMLTQRIALYGLAKNYAIGDPSTNNQHYKEAIEEFEIAYSKLMSSPQNNAPISAKYQLIDKRWKELKAAWAVIRGTSSKKRVINVLEETDSMMMSLNEIVTLYEHLKS